MVEDNNDKYKPVVYKLICEVFENASEPPSLTKSAVTRLVRDKKNNEYGLTGEAQYKNKNVQPSVSRALKKLEGENKLFYEGKFYYPDTPKGMRYLKRQKIVNLPFKEDGIFFVSPSTVLLSIRGLSKAEVVDDNEDLNNVTNEPVVVEKTLDRKEVKNLFNEYLTDKHCFNIHVNNNYVVLLIKGNDEELREIGEDLTGLAKKSWELHNPPKIKLKIKEVTEDLEETEEQEAQEQTETE